MAPPARCLDLTRSVARAGRRPTGVDRVERAYLERFLDEPEPLWGLVRTRLGFLLIDQAGLEAERDRLTGRAPWPSPDLLSRVSWRRVPGRARAEAGLRRRAVARSVRRRMGPVLAEHVPRGTAFFSIGLMNLTLETLAAARSVADARLAVMVHDTIPLDRPELARAGAPQRLRVLLDAVGRGADLLVCPSEVTAQGVERHVVAPPERMVLPLGVTTAVPEPEALPPGLDLEAPYFVALGTIEGRKNVGLLLDVWDRMAGGDGPVPTLYLCGARGWRSDDVRARLDAGVAGVRELPDLSDGAIAALLRGARALLFPSLAEGFGLPPWEALAQGTLPVCADLAIWREALGDRAVYLPPDDRYLWREEIERLARAPKTAVERGGLPGWDGHFKPLLRAGW